MLYKTRILVTAMSLISLLAAIPASAGEGESLADLKQELNALMLRIEALESLEAENRAPRQLEDKSDSSVRPDPKAIADQTSSSRYPFQPAADFRVRYESIDVAGSATQERARIRARASVARRISETVKVEFGVATGGDSPTSSTQTLGGGGSKKDLTLDLAYIDWAPVEGLNILAGKFRNPLFQVPSQTMLWDDEWRPEGVGAVFENDSFFASVLGTWLESDSLSGNRKFASGVQGGIRRKLGDKQFTAGFGYFDFSVSRSSTFYGSSVNFNGNSFECIVPMDSGSCVYLQNYREAELFTAMTFDRHLYAADVYAHYVRNVDADRFNDGWTIGSKLRLTGLDHPVELNYFYRHIEADAVFALLTDSDFGGSGTDATGHYFKAGWTASPGLVFSVTYFDNDVGADIGDPRKYKRVQLNADLSF